MSAPKPKPDPFVSKPTLVTCEMQARGQLDTAITVWFYYGDPVSIHTLAAAAQEILQGVAGKKRPSPLLKFLKTKPKSFQKKITDPQNVFKHAGKDPKHVIPYDPLVGETIITTAILHYQDVYHTLTPFMRAFSIRFSFERPTVYGPDKLTKKVTQGIKIDDLGGRDRPAFLDVVLRRFGVLPPRR